MLKGTTQVVWKFDEKKLLDELVSLKKTSSDEVFKTFPAIRYAVPEIRPFWATSFPDDPSKIKLTTVIDDQKPQ